MSISPNIRGQPMSPPISWMGGKRSILHIILARFPLLFERYIEVFGGSGVVLFGKEPSPFEVWNDYNGDLYNFYYCVKYRHLALLQELDFLPFTSRREFEQMNSFLAGKPVFMADEIAVARATLSPKDALQYVKQLRYRCKLGDVSRAAAFFKLNHMSYGSGMGSFNAQPCDLRRFYWNVYTAHARLIDTILENKDFEKLIRQYDREGSFFYLDPPYYMAEDCYEVVFSQKDHQRLHDVLAGVKGKWLLSYNDEPFIRELYKDYPQYRFTRLSNLNQRYEGGAEYPEILIANYDMEERGRQHEQLSFLS